MTYLAHRKGHYVLHCHDEGEPCRVQGMFVCEYRQTMWSRFKEVVRGRFLK